METNDFLSIIKNVYKQTFGYELDKLKVNADGTTTHIHSDRFLDEHPERKNNPEFTDEEELEMTKFIAEIAKKI